MDWDKAFGLVLKDLFDEHPTWQKTTMSINAGFSGNFLSKVIRGHRGISLNELEKFAPYLQMSIDDLYERAKEKKNCITVTIPRDLVERAQEELMASPEQHAMQSVSHVVSLLREMMRLTTSERERSAYYQDEIAPQHQQESHQGAATGNSFAPSTE